MKFPPTLLLIVIVVLASTRGAANGPLVLQTDFGQRDGAVAAMKGVAVGVKPGLPIFDLSHDIAPYDIWEAAYTLNQTASYWPAGTVFVSVVDPGVGTDRQSIVLRTKSGHFFVSPDNGTLTLVAETLGVDAVRRIDEAVNRLQGSETSYTFHGRDVFAYTGARLASGVIAFEQVGPELAPDVVRLAYTKARREGDALVGGIPALDARYGNVWTNISAELLRGLGVGVGDRVRIEIRRDAVVVHTSEVVFAHTFGDVPQGQSLLYLNSLLNASVAINQGNFAAAHGIAAGADWTFRLEKLAPPPAR